MARKDIFKGTLEALINPTEAPARVHSKSILQSVALGGVESGLARGMQLLDLDPSQISQSEFTDRMPFGDSDLSSLIASMREQGQQIPILVQRDGTNAFRVIYGRRRIAAASALGVKVRALVTQMDDDQRIIAQGVENTVRQDLSFIEKALFAHRLRAADVSEPTIRAALNIDVGAPKATTISTMKMVVETLGEDLIEAIGRAPGVGRPRWRALADMFRQNADQFTGASRPALLARIAGFAAANPDDPDASDPSDERFRLALKLVSATPEAGAKSAATKPAPGDATNLATIKRSKTVFSLTVKAKDNPQFHAWLQENADALIDDWHRQWHAQSNHNPEKEAR